MDRIQPPLREQYERWSSQIGCSYTPRSEIEISVDDVLRAHYLLCDYFLEAGEQIALSGPRNADLLVSAVARQSVGWGAERKWTEPVQVIATAFYGLVKNHPFHDGNKRTALLTSLYQILKCGRMPIISQRDFEQVVVRTAANNLPLFPNFSKFSDRYSEVDARVYWLADFFRRATRKVDGRTYIITYRELESILRRFGFSLENPSGNFIDIVRPEVQRTGFLGLKSREVRQKVGQIGFPGWTKEVGAGALKTVRRATGLTAQQGVDSQVFFKDADPTAALIDRYHGPLTRLRDK